MGENTSKLPPPPANFPYFSLTFVSQFNTIKLIDCDQQCLALIQQVIEANLPSGVMSKSFDVSGAFKIIYGGTPFSKGCGTAEALAGKRMCCVLLIALHSIGWELHLSSDLSLTTDLTTWFFQKNPALIGKPLPADGGIICLSLSSHDKLQLVNAPSHLHNELLQCVGPLLQKHEVHGTDLELKMIGYPWSNSDFEEGVTARQLLLNIIRKFDSFNYRFYGTADLKGTADSIFFEHDPNYAPGETRFCMLSLNCNDRIRLIDCPQEVVDVVGRCINEYWPEGIQDTRRHEHCVEYKLKGNPWNTSGDEAINSRYLITVVLQSLVSIGWAVMSALDISRRVNDKAVFVLRSCAPASIAHFCLSPSDNDLIRLINAPEDVQNAVSRVMRYNWPDGVIMEGKRLMAHEWKLNGHPWESGGGNDSTVSRQLMTRLMNEMACLGCSVICSADVAANYIRRRNYPDHPSDVHCWFIVRTGLGYVAQMPEAAGSSSTIGLTMPSAPLPPSSEPVTPPPSYQNAMNEKH